MNTKTTLTVVGLALALGLVFLAFETDLFKRTESAAETDTTGQAPVDAQTVLARDGKPILAEKDIKHIRIEAAGRPAVTLARENDRWMQTEPVRFPAEGFEIDNLIRQAVSLRFTQQFTPAEKQLTLDQLGLAPVRVTLALADASGKSLVTLNLGKRVLAGGAYLVVGDVSESSRVFVVSDGLHAMLLDAEPHKWRSKTLAAFPPGNIKAIQLQRGGQTLSLAQQDGQWSFTDPAPGRADRNTAQQIARVLTDTRIERFVQDNPADLSAYGLDEPSYVLSVHVTETGAESQAHTLLIGSRQALDDTSPRLAMLEGVPVVFTLPHASLTVLEKTTDELRDPRLTPLPRNNVKQISIERQDQPMLRLIREAEAWTFGDPAPAYGVEQDEVERLVQNLFETKAQSYIAPYDPGQVLPAAIVFIKPLTGTNDEKLSVYSSDNDSLIVVRNGEAVGYEVTRSSLSGLFEPSLAYRDRVALKLVERDILQLRVLRSGEHAAEYIISRGEPTEKQAAPGAWRLEGLEADKVRDLIAQLTPLRVEAWLAEAPVTTPEGVLVEITRGDASKVRLFLHPDSLTGRLDGTEEAFAIAPALADLAGAELRDTVALKLELEKLATVRLGDSLIQRSGQGSFHIEGEEVGESQAAMIFDALSGLRVKRYIPAADAGVDLNKPDHTLVLTTRDDSRHTLRLWAPTGVRKQWIGRLDDLVDAFTLDENTALRLLGKGKSPQVPIK